MRKLLMLTGLLFSVTLVLAQGQNYTGLRDFIEEKSDTSRADAIITNATVYFGYGAELTHETRVKVDANTKIIVINQLSTEVDPNSIQISCPEDVALLSHRYNVFYPTAPEVVKSRDVLRLEDSIAILQRESGRIDNLIIIQQEIMTKTNALIEATINKSNEKVMTAEALKLIEYNNNMIDKARTTIYNHRQNQFRLNEQIIALRSRIALLGNIIPPSLLPYGQIIMQVMCKKVEEIPVSLSYYTNNAGWTPVYDIRVNSKTNKVKLVYKAALTQSSGINWKKTKLTLSTGTPNFGVQAPVLSPWHLQQYVPGLYTDLQKRAAIANANRNMINSMNNDAALKEMVEEKSKDASGYSVTTIDPSTLQEYTTLNAGQLNTNFEIDLPYDIQSNGELHSVAIKNEEIDCSLKNYAIPRMDKEAYLLAEIADWETLDLLPGDANIIMDDTYIGKSVIDPNTTADTLNLSLGKDKRVAIKRSAIKELSSIRTSGKESRQSFTYEISVKNNKLSDVNLLLKDQFPLSNIKEIEVELADDTDGASVNKETGVLTWKVALKPGESRKFRFSYTVKYPKDMKIVNLK